jgi:rubrerythrin
MEDLTTFENVIDFAIKNEIEANKMYMELANTTTISGMKEVFEGFAKEEAGHKAKLEAIKSGNFALPLDTNVQDLRIGDFLVDVEPEPDMSYQEVLVFAMKKEKEAFKLYTTLANFTDDANLKETFFALAQEEANHKLRFEIEYDDNILTDN